MLVKNKFGNNFFGRVVAKKEQGNKTLVLVVTKNSVSWVNSEQLREVQDTSGGSVLHTILRSLSEMDITKYEERYEEVFNKLNELLPESVARDQAKTVAAEVWRYEYQDNNSESTN
jgi:hypothetical protein